MKKYLALDIGNVLVNQDMEAFVKPLSKQMNVSKQDAFHFVNRIQHKQDIGVTSVRDELASHFKIESEYILDDLIESWYKVCIPNVESMTGLSQIVDEVGAQVVLVSNLGFEHRDYFNKVMDCSLYQNAIKHFSCEIGIRKPTPTYYKLLTDFHPEFAGCVYVDDLDENLKTAQKMGLQSFHYDLSKYNLNGMMTRLRELKEFLLK